MKSKLLLVDDSKGNIMVLMSILMNGINDFQIYTTTKPEEVIALLHQYKPDLLITDWDMPVLNGIELIKLVRAEKQFQNMPIIMASGVMTELDNLKTALDAGATDFVKKPYESIEILARTNAALNLANLNKKLLEEKENQSIENTLMLIRRTKLQYQVMQEINKFEQYIGNNTEAISLLNSIRQLMDITVKSENDKQFDIAFKSAHAQFYNNLSLHFPLLSPSEIRLCAYIRLGLNSKDIASLMFVTTDSVKVFRSRIRKKLNLDTETNLQTFLSNF